MHSGLGEKVVMVRRAAENGLSEQSVSGAIWPGSIVTSLLLRLNKVVALERGVKRLSTE